MKLHRPYKSRTYSAFYQKDHSRIIFRRQPAEQVKNLLPPGAVPLDDPRSTITQNADDPLAFAFFVLPNHEVIVVQADGVAPIMKRTR